MTCTIRPLKSTSTKFITTGSTIPKKESRRKDSAPQISIETSRVRTQDGDAELVHSGFHPVVAGPGYNVYYLNFLAGTSRTLSVSEDPSHVWVKSTWKETDPRLPLVR